jgi:hypothetical protein
MAAALGVRLSKRRRVAMVTRLDRPFLIGLSSKSADISIPMIAT